MIFLHSFRVRKKQENAPLLRWHVLTGKPNARRRLVDVVDEVVVYLSSGGGGAIAIKSE